jgi:CRISPR-associated protein Cmr1
MELQFITRTPLWTGDIDGRATSIQTSAIIGSLRWWYEVVIRGLGGFACDPTNSNCLYNDKLANKGICVVCRTFGTTGWGRRFRLTVESNVQPSSNLEGKFNPTGTRKKVNTNQNPTWYFNGGLKGEFTLKIVALSPEFDPILLQGLLHLIVKRAALAAKPQLGYGLIEAKDSQLFDAENFVERIKQECNQKIQNDGALPTLTDFFFVDDININFASTSTKHKIEDIQHVLNLKYDLRAALRSRPIDLQDSERQKIRHFICGEIQHDNRKTSKIAISNPFNNKIRVWGWIPKQLPVQSVKRSQVLEIIFDSLKNYSGTAPIEWFDYHSVKDSRNYTAPDAFLKALLN